MKLLRHMWQATFLAAVLVLQALVPSIASAQTINVLWYTYEPAGSEYRIKMQELATSAHTYAAGSGLTWELTFFGPTDTPDFTAYDALVIGQEFRGDYRGILNNKAAITSARGTRTFISGQNADWHYIYSPGAIDDGPRGFLVNAVNWAASGTGLGIVALYDIGLWWTDPNSFLHDELVGHVLPANIDSVIIPAATAGFPVNAGLTSTGLSNWFSSAHALFSKALPGYLAINDYGGDPANWSVTVVTESEAGGGTSPFLAITMDIKFLGTPNAFNCSAKGVVPITLFGTAQFDVSGIDISTLRLERLDGTGGSVGPVRAYSIQDRGSPLDAGINVPSLRVYNPDGFADIDVGFDARAVATLIGCAGLTVGSTSPHLIVTGELDDGTPLASQNSDVLLIQNK